MTSPPPRLRALDALRGVTILWVATMHFAADTRGLPGAEIGPPALWARLSSGDVFGTLGGAVTGILFLPGFRLDLLLFVTGLVLSLGRPLPAIPLLIRRARAILPGYWLGTLAVTAVLMLCAGLRAAVLGTPFTEEALAGSRLAGNPYLFAPEDVLRSATVVGRFQSPATVQVVSPSLWYIALVAQFYVAYPLMRWMLMRLGASGFLVVCTLTMLACRAAVLNGLPTGSFDPVSALASFLPFRLASPALGMVVAPWLRVRAEAGARPGGTAFRLVVAAALLLVAGWISAGHLLPVNVALAVGPSLAVPPAMVGLWLLAGAMPGPVHALLVWAGGVSLALLVVQDALRFVVGTAISLGVPLSGWLWPVLPLYLAAALGLTRLWWPVTQGFADLIWPARRAGAQDAAPSPAPRDLMERA
ncbi:MAG: acyltransferase family protein [Acidobacteria bacterium]|nr:acyltransferase family protein [Acidobacteriota bacterium]